jgi:hypothetical protein
MTPPQACSIFKHTADSRTTSNTSSTTLPTQLCTHLNAACCVEGFPTTSAASKPSVSGVLNRPRPQPGWPPVGRSAQAVAVSASRTGSAPAGYSSSNGVHCKNTHCMQDTKYEWHVQVPWVSTQRQGGMGAHSACLGHTKTTATREAPVSMCTDLKLFHTEISPNLCSALF